MKRDPNTSERIKVKLFKNAPELKRTYIGTYIGTLIEVGIPTR